MKKEIVEEISKKYCKNEKFIVLLIKICKDNNVNDELNCIEKYLIKCVNRCVK